ncbi:TetR/AcrR family transcriptional regulator [Alteromonadaceae bacterium M269]|nr:TetR/AcrR family transcriptional regulator [Alteromonadaceae bacterium M269]
MPRPNMVAKRTEEILDAFEQCILEASLEATSLEKLAEKAAMKRSLLRHYIGNRDDIIIALCERYQNYYSELWRQTAEWLPEKNRVEALIEMLFAERNQTYIDKCIVGEAVYAQAKRLDQVRQYQVQAIQQSIQILVSELKRAYPNAKGEKQYLIARAILSNYLQSEALLPLNFHEEIGELKSVSLMLLKLLED